MSATLKCRLREFDAAPAPARMRTAHGPAMPAAAPLDLEAERAAAREEGRQAATEALAAEHEAVVSRLLQEHAAGIAALEQKHEAEIADLIERRFGELLTELGGRIGRETAAAVAPFVEDAVADRMASAFADSLVEALDGRDVTHLEVSGPAALFERLSAAPALAGVELRHVAAEQPDLAVEVDGTVLATRLGAFTDLLREALR